MEHSMRDLDRLQEQDPDERGRQLGVWLVLATMLLGLFGAVYVVWSRAHQPKANEPDPLDQLTAVPAAPAGRAAPGGEVKPSVDPTTLVYEQALGNDEERPEVIAALAAAKREEEQLSGSARVPPVAPVPPAQMPAALTASAGNKLVKDARHDPLVAAVLPKSPNAHTRANAGSDGDFVLQVLSYEVKKEADDFASALRDRGHEAYVAAGHVDGRGRTFRVRVGPFKSKGAADAYRRQFEERERMNTIVLRRDEQ
jgi:DedD protein